MAGCNFFLILKWKKFVVFFRLWKSRRQPNKHKLIQKRIEHWNAAIILILFHLISIRYAVCCLCFMCIVHSHQRIIIYLWKKKNILFELIRNLRFEICDLCDLHGGNDDDEIYRWTDSRLQEKKRVFCLKNCLFFILRFPSVVWILCVLYSTFLWSDDEKIVALPWCSFQSSFNIIW